MRQKTEQVRKDVGNIKVSGEHLGYQKEETETMPERIERIRHDLKELERFYNIEISTRRTTRLQKYFAEQLTDLRQTSFDSYDQEGKIDYLLLQNYLKRRLAQLDLETAKDKKTELLFPFASTIVRLCEDRQQMIPINGEQAARDVYDVGKQISTMEEKVKSGKVKIDKTSAFRAAKTVDQLHSHLAEWFGYFNGYDPMFTWWVAKPYAIVNKQLKEFASTIREELVGIKRDDKDAIVGDPIGHAGLMADLEAEKIPYTPEELIQIGETDFVWCEEEIVKASRELGFGDDWRKALEYVKDQYVDPGKQPELIRHLADEATEYVKEHDLVTVPPLADELWRMFMMAPERQKVNPFFLGGTSIIVSYPTDTMDHESKLMSMRGNNIHFARATVFHELIPGHHLQGFMNDRYRSYRKIFNTPFSVEGWSLYWEVVLWNDEKFPKTPENRIGMLFWRMHRCARIIFSLKFHLGEMTPQECIDFLVDRVGHERENAEGEVRRSFAGDYSPLYQAGYMLGGFQLYSLRQELVNSGKMTEKQFHDRVLKENQMPIELLRALIKEQPLTPDFKSSWRFYKGL